jgi:hypothetical protein
MDRAPLGLADDGVMVSPIMRGKLGDEFPWRMNTGLFSLVDDLRWCSRVTLVGFWVFLHDRRSRIMGHSLSKTAAGGRIRGNEL